ncbi:Integrase, catalytic core [Corchorus olitorius]|uniref:Integrase, catalytic core n=1 Tax=Corchorus olitorius TaxID=93759 RepID=A0A1R3IYZ3_9ROSI|nr:Integrase, catalytic core [Corchorus olitorius]
MSISFETMLNDSSLQGEASRKGKNHVDLQPGGSGQDVYPETPDARQIRAASEDQTPTLRADKLSGIHLHPIADLSETPQCTFPEERGAQTTELPPTTSDEATISSSSIPAPFGVPHVIVSDNKLQLQAKHIQQFCRKNRVTLVASSVVHPHTNGQKEAINRKIMAALKNKHATPMGSGQRSSRVYCGVSERLAT